MERHDVLTDTVAKIYVNASPLQLARPGFHDGLLKILQSAPAFPPDALCIEVTENFAADTTVVETLTRISAAGVSVAIDDFGTGFSSVSCLRHMPADEVKLDRSFLSGFSMDRKSVKFLRILNDLIHAAGMRVVQEGVETQAQLDLMRAVGVDMVQGYFLSLPLTGSEAAQFAQAHTHG